MKSSRRILLGSLLFLCKFAHAGLNPPPAMIILPHDHFGLRMVENPSEVESALRSGFKLITLKGDCDVDPEQLPWDASTITFNGRKLVTTDVRNGCSETLERDAIWIKGARRALLLTLETGGKFIKKCSDSVEDINFRVAFYFDMDVSGKFVGVQSTAFNGCWWAKRID